MGAEILNSETVRVPPGTKGEFWSPEGCPSFSIHGWEGLEKSRMGVPVRRGIEVRKVDLESQEEKGTQRSRVSAGP